MRIHEAAKAAGCTQRAIKFYEEKGLLPPVSRSENGYREYSQEDLRVLHTIQAYRKLGIGISDIKALLADESKAVLREILEKKEAEARAQQEEIRALKAYIASGDAKQLDEAIDFESIAQAMRTQIPGFFGQYLCRHFAPYLNIRIETEEQKDACRRILEFWDNPGLKLPLLYHLSAVLSFLTPQIRADQIDAQIKSMLSPDEAVYARLLEQTQKAVRLRENPLVRFSPAEMAKRSMMRRLQDCGYYDIFLPQMERLSPAYKAYRDALSALNTQICEDLGLHYDSRFHLVISKKA